jgi:hypothetical protein
MKVIFFILIALMAATRLRSQCDESQMVAEKNFGSNFIAEPQHVQGIISRGDSLSFESLWIADNTYRIATSATEKQTINITIFDKNKNIIFDGSEFNYPSDWDFFVERSLEVRCVIRCEMPEPACVTVLTGFRK